MVKRSKNNTNVFAFKRAPIRTAVAGLIVAGAIYTYIKFAPEIPMKVRYSKRLLSKFPFITGTNTPPYYQVVYHTFDAKDTAVKMERAMRGITTAEPMLKYYNLIINDLTYNDLRALHNMWLKYVDRKTSLYDWIFAEGEEGTTQDKQYIALQKMTRAGVGVRSVLRIPHNELLTI